MLFTRLSAVALGLGLSLTGAFDVPYELLSSMSEDGVLHPTTLGEARVLRWVCLATGLLFFALSFAAHRWRRWLEQVPAPPLPQATSSSLHIVVLLCSALLVIAAVVTASWAASSPDPQTFKLICEESGVWESLSALAFLASSVLFALAARTAVRRWPALLFSAGAFLLCMEEISWGQHWFGWDTPEALSELNTQNETNFHNIGGYWSHQIIMLATFAWLALIPICMRLFWDFRTVFRHLRLPVAPASLIPLGFVAPFLDERSRFYALWGGPYPWRLSEARELALGVGLLFTAWVFARSRSTS